MTNTICAGYSEEWKAFRPGLEAPPWRRIAALTDAAPHSALGSRARGQAEAAPLAETVVLTAATPCDCTSSGSEMPLGLERIASALAEADLFVAVGTSGAAYPAAGLVDEALTEGVRALEINLERTDGVLDEVRKGPAPREVVRWVDEVLGG